MRAAGNLRENSPCRKRGRGDVARGGIPFEYVDEAKYVMFNVESSRVKGEDERSSTSPPSGARGW